MYTKYSSKNKKHIRKFLPPIEKSNIVKAAERGVRYTLLKARLDLLAYGLGGPFYG